MRLRRMAQLAATNHAESLASLAKPSKERDIIHSGKGNSKVAAGGSPGAG
jgi:hypothetical protein